MDFLDSKTVQTSQCNAYCLVIGKKMTAIARKHHKTPWKCKSWRHSCAWFELRSISTLRFESETVYGIRKKSTYFSINLSKLNEHQLNTSSHPVIPDISWHTFSLKSRKYDTTGCSVTISCWTLTVWELLTVFRAATRSQLIWSSISKFTTVYGGVQVSFTE